MGSDTLDPTRAEVLVGFPREVSGLAVLRSLRKHGLTVSAYDCHPGSAGLYTRGLKHRYRWPCPDTQESAFIESLLSAGNETSRPVLLDLEPTALAAINRHQDVLRRRFRFVLPPPDVLDIAQDKAKTAAFFARHGLGAPITLEVTREGDIEGWRGGFPAVFKPRRGKGGRGQRIVASPGEARDYWRARRPGPADYLLQEWIPGPSRNLYTVGLLCAPGGAPRALFSAQRLDVVQTARVPQGPTSLVRSLRVPDLLDIARSFAQKSEWTGMAELEFKKDERDGTFKILEINPRIWAWIQLPITCGIDFPHLYYTMATTGDCETVSSFKENVTYLRSVLHLYTQLYRLSAGNTGLWQCAREIVAPYLALFRPAEHVVLEDLGLRPEYVRWFLFHLRDADL